jgi:hypothetical protein
LRREYLLYQKPKEIASHGAEARHRQQELFIMVDAALAGAAG